jgi:hypothetical protein
MGNYFLNDMRKIGIVLVIAMLRISLYGATYYSRNSGGNWSTTSTWSTVNYGGSSAAGFPGTNDTAKIGNGYTIVVNTNSACAQLDIGQGVSGIVQYSGASAYSLTVGGNVTVNAGASLLYNLNSTRTHTLLVGGNIMNNGSVSLYYDGNDFVNLTINTALTTTVSGTGSWALNNVTVNKTSAAAIVEVQVIAFESAINTLTATAGTFIHNNSGSYSVNSASATDFAINANMVFKVPQGTVTFSPNSSRTYLYGGLYITGGNVYVGATAGTNGIRYDKTGTGIPYLEVSSGSLTVYGGITYASGAGADPLIFSMSGGTMLLNCGSTGSSAEALLVNDVATSAFTMSDGVIKIQNHNTSSGNNCADWHICGSAGTVNTTGGMVEFGNISTPTATKFDFVPFANAVQPSFKVTGDAAAAITLQTSKGATSDFKLLSLYVDTNKTFDVTSISGSAGNTKTLTITSTFDGSSSFYSSGTFAARSGKVLLGGTSAQSIGGSSTTAFYDLTIDNVSGVTLISPVNVTNYLNMSNGILTATSTNILTCTATASSSSGTATSYIEGPMFHTVAQTAAKTLNYPIGKAGDFRPAVLTPVHSTAASVTYRGEVVNSPAAALAYSLPPSLSSVSYVRYWLFTRAAIANFTSATMQLSYGVNDYVLDSASLRIAQGNGALWENEGGSGSASVTGTITSGSFSSFNTVFTLAYTAGAGSLPVHMLNFAAARSGDNVRLHWATASEINNDYFTVERSADGNIFHKIAFIKGAGNSSQEIEYSLVDTDPLQGVSYYRIRQTDFDGTTDCSGVIAIAIFFEREQITVAPTVVTSNYVTVYLKGMKNQSANISLCDASGKILHTENVFLTAESEHLQVTVPVGLNGSTCIINVATEGASYTRKIFIRN